VPNLTKNVVHHYGNVTAYKNCLFERDFTKVLINL